MSGLSYDQQWAHDHLDRCPCCGSWELITEREKYLRERAARLGIATPITTCHHIGNALTSQENHAA